MRIKTEAKLRGIIAAQDKRLAQFDDINANQKALLKKCFDFIDAQLEEYTTKPRMDDDGIIVEFDLPTAALLIVDLQGVL